MSFSLEKYKKMIRSITLKDRANILFLLFSFSLLLLLTFTKYREKKNVKQFIQSARKERYSPRIKIEQITLTFPSRTIYLAKNLISNAQYHQFISSTGYLTDRERSDLWPRWSFPSCENESSSESSFSSWQSDPSAPAIYLTKKDAEAFCSWLSEEAQSDAPLFSLPTKEELDHLEAGDVWEWTSQTLADFDGAFPHGTLYLTSWKKESPLRHRREIDSTSSHFEPTGFRVRWSFNNSAY